jgi:hypothetical protein
MTSDRTLPTQRCQGCGYDLSNPPESIPEPRCPECGVHFFPGEHPAPDWPGAGDVYLESSGLFFALVVLGTSVCFAPVGLGIGLVLLVPAAAIGIITPILASREYGARFPTHAARWRSRRRVWLIATALNAAVASAALVVLRLAPIR